MQAHKDGRVTALVLVLDSSQAVAIKDYLNTTILILKNHSIAHSLGGSIARTIYLFSGRTPASPSP